jgi:hypothetical protein
MFPFSIWAIASSCKSLTTNAYQSFHSEFDSNSYHHHSNIFKILEYDSKQITHYVKSLSYRNNTI